MSPPSLFLANFEFPRHQAGGRAGRPGLAPCGFHARVRGNPASFRIGGISQNP